MQRTQTRKVHWTWQKSVSRADQEQNRKSSYCFVCLFVCFACLFDQLWKHSLDAVPEQRPGSGACLFVLFVWFVCLFVCFAKSVSQGAYGLQRSWPLPKAPRERVTAGGAAHARHLILTIRYCILMHSCRCRQHTPAVPVTTRHSWQPMLRNVCMYVCV